MKCGQISGLLLGLTVISFSAFGQTPVDEFLEAAKKAEKAEIPDTVFEGLEAMEHEKFQAHASHNKVIHWLKDHAEENPRCFTALARLGEDQHGIVTQVLEFATQSSASGSLRPIAATLEDASSARRQIRHTHSISHDEVFLLVLQTIERVDAYSRDQTLALLLQLARDPFLEEFQKFLRRNPTSTMEVKGLLSRAVSEIDRERASLGGDARVQNRQSAEAIRTGAEILSLPLPPAPPETPEPLAEELAKQEPAPRKRKHTLPSPRRIRTKPINLRNVDPLLFARGLLSTNGISDEILDEADRTVRTAILLEAQKLIHTAQEGSRAEIAAVCDAMLRNREN